jgi:hypothetical protein
VLALAGGADGGDTDSDGGNCFDFGGEEVAWRDFLGRRFSSGSSIGKSSSATLLRLVKVLGESSMVSSKLLLPVKSLLAPVVLSANFSENGYGLENLRIHELNRERTIRLG